MILDLQQDWLTENYTQILQWARNICKNDPLYEELAHYSIEQFMTHSKYRELVQKPGDAKGFLLAIMRNSWIGSKSHFSRLHKAHRADVGHRKRAVTDEYMNQLLDVPEEPYDEEIDYQTEAIVGILEEMELHVDEKLWFNARLFKLWLEIGNFSEISRRTGIPRMSISNAVDECREYVKQELKKRGIIT